MDWRELTAGGLVALALLAAPALAQTPPAAQARPDILPEVTLTGRPAAEIDVMANRLTRFVNSRCFIGGSTERFNRAYYATLTGQADYYDTLKASLPVDNAPVRRRYRYPGSAFGQVTAQSPDPAFMIANAYSSAPGRASIMKNWPATRGPEESQGCSAPGMRANAGRNTTFARAMAHYDRGEYATALPLFKQARGELGPLGLGAEAALMVGKMYLAGEGTPKDGAQALVWLDKTMADRRPREMDYRGYVTRSTRFNRSDPDRYYKATSEAAVLIAGLYVAGEGVPRDPEKARVWMKIAANDDHVPAVKLLADFYRDGYGGASDPKTALTYYEAAAKMGHALSAYEAGDMFAHGEGAAKNPVRAIKYYQEASLLGDGPAAYELALAYDQGLGAAANPKWALAYYKIAAERGDPRALTAMGTYFYEGGALIQKDHIAARGWFQEASIRGEPDAMVNLAAMLIKGEGGAADPVKAWAWLSLARKGGRDDVTAGLASLEGRLAVEDLAKARALVEG